MARTHDDTQPTRAETGPRPRGTSYERIENAEAPLVPRAEPTAGTGESR
jgi:hypothetical protein